MRDWLRFGLNGRDVGTLTTNTFLCERHIVPFLGARRLRDLSADDVDKWLAGRAKTLSRSTLGKLHSALNRAIKRAMARTRSKGMSWCFARSQTDGRAVRPRR